MGRFTGARLAKRDDPIFKEGLTIFTPRSARGSIKPVEPPQQASLPLSRKKRAGKSSGHRKGGS